jgi:hypothetical protein
MNDEEAHAFYSDPTHLAVAGPGQRRERPMKTVMTPVRFAPEMIAAVKRFASEDGMTVSTWIRGIIAREIRRRQPPATSAGPAPKPQLEYTHNRSPQSETASSSNVVPELCGA